MWAGYFSIIHFSQFKLGYLLCWPLYYFYKALLQISLKDITPAGSFDRSSFVVRSTPSSVYNTLILFTKRSVDSQTGALDGLNDRPLHFVLRRYFSMVKTVLIVAYSRRQDNILSFNKS